MPSFWELMTLVEGTRGRYSKGKGCGSWANPGSVAVQEAPAGSPSFLCAVWSVGYLPGAYSLVGEWSSTEVRLFVLSLYSLR